MKKEHKSVVSFLNEFGFSGELDVIPGEILGYFENIRSSYNSNEFLTVFLNLGELICKDGFHQYGVLHGYSFLALSLGALNRNNKAAITGYDLFEDYQYNSSNLEEVRRRIHHLNLEKTVNVEKKSVLNSRFELTKPFSTDVNVIDLSNCGDIVESAIINFKNSNSKYLVLEGGSDERDSVEWMKKFDRRKIAPVLNNYANEFKIDLLDIFPSMTVVSKL